MILRRWTFSLLALAALAGYPLRPAAQATFTLEIPELQLKVPGESRGLLSRTDFNTFQIVIGPATVDYGSIRSRINTESASIIMETKTVGDSVVCSFDLNRHAGFRFNEGRNSVEIAARDTRGRVLYSSFLLDAPYAATAPPQPSSAAPEDIHGIEKYAVVVGVSHYKDHHIPQLSFADQDAESISKFLIEEGRFRPENVHLVLNENATLKQLKTELRTFLAKPREEDLVLIYFSGHGSNDVVNNPIAWYLLPYETDRNNMGGTAFPMEEIQDVFRVIKARRIVTFADACHSAGITGEPMAGISLGSPAGSASLSILPTHRPSRAAASPPITSASSEFHCCGAANLRTRRLPRAATSRSSIK